MFTSVKLTVTAAVLCLGAGGAFAGPCSDGIADLGRKLAQNPTLGPATTGALTGSNPGNAPSGTPGPGAPAPTGTSADNRVGGTGGTKEVNAAVGNLVATSPQDVRRQQEGLPTAAAVAAAGSNKSVETTPKDASQASSSQPQPNDRVAMAKMELERARMLDQKDDASCRGALDRARELSN